jgi:hypothetical protein
MLEALVRQEPAVFTDYFALAIQDTELTEWVVNELDEDGEDTAFVSRHCEVEDILSVLDDVVSGDFHPPAFKRAKDLMFHLFTWEKRQEVFQDPEHTALNISFLDVALRWKDFEAADMIAGRADNYCCDAEGAVYVALSAALIEHRDDPEVLEWVLGLDWGGDDSTDFDIEDYIVPVLQSIQESHPGETNVGQLRRVMEHLRDSHHHEEAAEVERMIRAM